MKNFRDFLKEGKREQDKMDELLDKGAENLTQEEKDLLRRLANGEKLPDEKPKKDGGYRDDPRDFLNKVLGTNIGPETKITQIGPGEDVDIPLTFGGGKFEAQPKITPKQPFKEGDRVTYIGNMHQFAGKKAKFLRTKENGKCSIEFDNGKKLVVNPKNLVLSKLDPYGEEEWNEDRDEDESVSNVPGDFYFNVGDFNDEGLIVTLVYVDYFNEHGCVADDLGSYNLSQNVIDALNNAGVYGDGELMESVWEVRAGFTAQQVRQNMIQAGFVQSNELDNFLNNLN